jgi:hypothetical protein
MKTFSIPLSSAFTAVALLALGLFLSTSQLEYCGQSDAFRPQPPCVNASQNASPTPAPPKKVVWIQIETDKPDLEVGWLQN